MATPFSKGNKPPKPFQRPGIDLGSTIGQKKDWKHVDPFLVEKGDIIQGHGLVESWERFIENGPRGRVQMVEFQMKSGETFRTYDSLIVAFTAAEGVPIG